MTIGGWVAFALLALCVVGVVIFIMACWESTPGRVLTVILGLAVIVAVLLGMLWWFNNTASGQRALTDQKSELANGLERVVRIYTANGDIIAEYEGIIDIEGNDGGYVLFDYQGKRYTYYNCFVESIKECHNCGWNWTGEPELIEYRPFNENAVYSADVALEVEDA